MIGVKYLKELARVLRELGLRPRWSDPTGLPHESPKGIRGAAKVLGSVDVPTGIAGLSGIIKFKVVEEDVPPLIPAGLTRALNMKLELSNDGDTAKFGNHGNVSRLRERAHSH